MSLVGYDTLFHIISYHIISLLLLLLLLLLLTTTYVLIVVLSVINPVYDLKILVGLFFLSFFFFLKAMTTMSEIDIQTDRLTDRERQTIKVNGIILFTMKLQTSLTFNK